MKKVMFYHGGCAICRTAEKDLAQSLDPALFDVEIVHLKEQRERISEAERFGVKSVPAFVINGHAFHVNYGLSITELKTTVS